MSLFVVATVLIFGLEYLLNIPDRFGLVITDIPFVPEGSVILVMRLIIASIISGGANLVLLPSARRR